MGKMSDCKGCVELKYCEGNPYAYCDAGRRIRFKRDKAGSCNGGTWKANCDLYYPVEECSKPFLNESHRIAVEEKCRELDECSGSTWGIKVDVTMVEPAEVAGSYPRE